MFSILYSPEAACLSRRVEAVLDWYAVYVRSRFERVTEQALARRGYQAFSPFYRIKRKASDRTKVIELPLFPGYVFCCFDAQRRLPIISAPGVVAVVGTGKTPSPISLAEVRSIQTVVNSGRPVRPERYLRQGQRVRIEAGPLCGVEGTLTKLKSACRLVVSVELLQRSIAVELDQESVLPLP
jgi:transcriptional antiterminator RfaH